MDKIELARTYSEVSGERNSSSSFCLEMKPHVLTSATDENCFNLESVVLYAAHVDSLRQTCLVQKSEGKLTDCSKVSTYP